MFCSVLCPFCSCDVDVQLGYDYVMLLLCHVLLCDVKCCSVMFRF